jgi:hypothetical protein
MKKAGPASGMKAQALAASPSITTLDLRGCNIGAAGMQALEAVRDRFEVLQLDASPQALPGSSPWWSPANWMPAAFRA